jgi:metal-responsive CopG/Arc/MetJ family transcriptional regulator
LSTHLPASLVEEVDRAAARRGQTPSELVDAAVQGLVDDEAAGVISLGHDRNVDELIAYAIERHLAR